MLRVTLTPALGWGVVGGWGQQQFAQSLLALAMAVGTIPLRAPGSHRGLYAGQRDCAPAREFQEERLDSWEHNRVERGELKSL